MPLIRRLGVLAALLLVAAAWSGSALAASAVGNTSLPAIDGGPQVGATLDRGTSGDAKDFTIGGTLTIDRGTKATATPPPDPVVMPGTTIVSSSDSGALKASLDSLAFGSARKTSANPKPKPKHSTPKPAGET